MAIDKTTALPKLKEDILAATGAPTEAKAKEYSDAVADAVAVYVDEVVKQLEAALTPPAP